MANREQLKLLKAGVDNWNKWRKDQPNEKINLANANLREANLSGANLTKADLRESDLEDADLKGANLSQADLRGSNLSEVNLTKADLRGVNLAGVNLGEATGSNLSETDLTKADLRGTVLSEANLWKADLRKVNLSETYLKRANLREANLREADLREVTLKEADLRKANLNDAYLFGVDLRGADLRGADLSGANIRETDLRGADLSETILYFASFFEVDLWDTNFGGTHIDNTLFRNIDLSETNHLETILHHAPSTIGADTLQLSKGKIPEAFLRGCGLSDILIETQKFFNPNLTNDEIVKIQYRMYDLRATQALQISPLFISYSHTDSAFIDTLEKGLNTKGVRFWRDIHDMTSGRIETQIDRAIRKNPTVLLILSKNSMNSDWVQHEVRKARDLEKELGRDVLCPIALDDSWNTESNHWPQRMMEQVKEYKILDFSKWEDESIFQAEFGKLLNGLDVFYKKPEA